MPDLASFTLPLPFPCLVHEHDHPLLIGWNSVVWLAPSHSVCFPFTEPGLCANIVFREIFAEFDKKCIGLQSLSAPLSVDFALWSC